MAKVVAQKDEEIEAVKSVAVKTVAGMDEEIGSVKADVAGKLKEIATKVCFVV